MCHLACVAKNAHGRDPASGAAYERTGTGNRYTGAGSSRVAEVPWDGRCACAVRPRRPDPTGPAPEFPTCDAYPRITLEVAYATRLLDHTTLYLARSAHYMWSSVTAELFSTSTQGHATSSLAQERGAQRTVFVLVVAGA